MPCRQYVQRTCPFCNKSFKRLDVHLSRSVQCSNTSLATLQWNAPVEAEIASQPISGSSSPLSSPDHVDCSSDQSQFCTRPRLKLPTSAEDWKSADEFLATVLVPKVCGEYVQH